MDGVDRLAAGNHHGCAIARERVYCWGTPRAIEGDTTPAHAASLVPGVEHAVDVKAAGRQTCALVREGALYCWGERFRAPAPGEPNVAVWNPLTGGPPPSMRAQFHPAPVRVRVANVRAFGVGRTHACALDASRALYCWGSNANGEIGADATHDAPHRVAEGVEWMRVGQFFTCWRGAEIERCIGVAPEAPELEAPFVDHTRDVLAETTCMIFADRHVGCVGRTALASAIRSARTDFVELALGAFHACARRETNEVHCWGGNRSNQLGVAVGDETQGSLVPGVRARQIGAGLEFTCALTEARTVVCWGATEGGAIGVEAAAAMTSTPSPQTIRRVE